MFNMIITVKIINISLVAGSGNAPGPDQVYPTKYNKGLLKKFSGPFFIPGDTLPLSSSSAILPGTHLRELAGGLLPVTAPYNPVKPPHTSYGPGCGNRHNPIEKKSCIRTQVNNVINRLHMETCIKNGCSLAISFILPETVC